MRAMAVRRNSIADALDVDKLGLSSGSHQAGNIRYEWISRDNAQWLSKFKRGSKQRNSLVEGATQLADVLQTYRRKNTCRTILDQLPTPILPWTESNVSDVLQMYHVESAEKRFGIPLQELVAELRKGEFFFGLSRADGKLFCVADRVCLRAAAADSRVVFQKNMEMKQCGIDRYTLPFTSKLADESAWSAARRIAYTCFGGDALSERVCIQECVAPEHVESKGLLSAPQLGHPTASIVYRTFVVAALIPVEPIEFVPRF